MGRHVAANGITLLIVALVFTFGLINWGKAQFYGAGPLSEATIVEIPSGSSVKRITRKLVDVGAISSGWIFQTGLNYSGQEESLKFGVYEIPAGASMEEVANLLSSGSGAGTRYQATFRIRADSLSPRLLDRIEATNFSGETPEQIFERIRVLTEGADSIELRVAIPEGLTSYQIVEGLRAMPFMAGEIADIPFEGALAPNTFSIRAGSDRQEVVDKMLVAQTATLARVWEGRDPDVPLKDVNELLVLASIIEKETGVSSERKQVSSVFVNRLRRGMRLQTDPTVIYGITQGREVLGRGLRRSELDASTPYNTYVIPGLPPGPIANPGTLAIEAAAHPDSTDFLFFVADGSGGHAFARTLSEHEANVVRWRQIEAERAAN